MRAGSMKIGLSVIALGLFTAACGSTDRDRALTGGLGGAAIGAFAGPAGALAGLAVGAIGGYALDESADRKVSRLGDTFVNRPLADATGIGTASAATQTEYSGSADRGARRMGYMTVDEIHDELHDAGYERVTNVRRDGDIYRARVMRGGRTETVMVDPETGNVISADEARRMRRESASGEAWSSGPMNEQQVRRKLRQEGYTQISNVQRQGNAYLAQAQWENRIYDVRVDAQTGRIMSSESSGQQGRVGPGGDTQRGNWQQDTTTAGPTGASGVSETQIRSTLQQEGYSQVSNVRRDGNAYAAQAQRGGQTYNVRVDAVSGRILQASPM